MAGDWRYKMRRLVLLLVCVMVLWGCANIMRYEYRYRVFYGVELEGKEKLSTEEFSKLFYPIGSLNQAMDMFGEEGFELYDYQRLGQGHNYIFKFRRATKWRAKKVLPARQIYGIYQVSAGKTPTLLAVLPTPEGVEVVKLGDVEDRFPARLENGEVIYKTPAGEVTLSFTTEDGLNQKVKKVNGDTIVIKNYRGKRYKK